MNDETRFRNERFYRMRAVKELTPWALLVVLAVIVTLLVAYS